VAATIIVWQLTIFRSKSSNYKSAVKFTKLQDIIRNMKVQYALTLALTELKYPITVPAQCPYLHYTH
jgi:hypothetical protein